MFSGLVVFGGPTLTGYSVLDAGPDVEFNPDFIGLGDYYSNIGTGVLVIFVLIVTQVLIYMAVTRVYNKSEEDSDF